MWFQKVQNSQVNQFHHLSLQVEKLSDKVDLLIETGNVNTEHLQQIQSTLDDHSGLLNSLTLKFKQKIATLNKIVVIGSIFLFLILLWIVLKI